MLNRKRTAIMALLLSAAVVHGVSGCGQKPSEPTPASTVSVNEEADFASSGNGARTDTSDASGQPSDASLAGAENGEAYKALQAFADAIKNEDYGAVMGMVAWPDNSIVSEDDVRYYMKRSDYAKLLGKDAAMTGFEEGATKATARLGAGAADVGVAAVYGDDDIWRVDLHDAYLEDAVIFAPGDCPMSLNGVALDMGAAAAGPFRDGSVLYTVTLPNRPVTAEIETAFGAFEMELRKAGENDYGVDFTADPRIEGAALDESLDRLTEVLNGLCGLYYSGSREVTDYEPYFGDHVTASQISDAIGVIGKALREKGGQFKSMELWPGQTCRVRAYNTLSMNVRYKFHFTEGLLGSVYSSDKAGIYLEKKADGTYGIGGKVDNLSNVFNSMLCNPYNKEW